MATAASEADRPLDLICMGEPLIEFNQQPSPDGRPVYLQGIGGDTSNAAIAAARQGVRVAYLTAVGADAFGDMLLQIWEAEDVDVRFVRRDNVAPTGIYFVSHGPDGHHFTYRRAGSAASLLSPAEVPDEMIGATRIFHASAISQAISSSCCDAVFHAIARARQLGTYVSYDTNLRLRLWGIERARAVIHETIGMADLTLASIEEGQLLTGLTDADAIVDTYLRYGAQMVVLKLGPEGALLANAEGRLHVKGHRVATVDATGAGDAFAGGFLARLIAGDSPDEAARYANAVAALSTTGFGAVAPIPRKADVEAFLAERR